MKQPTILHPRPAFLALVLSGCGVKGDKGDKGDRGEAGPGGTNRPGRTCRARNSLLARTVATAFHRRCRFPKWRASEARRRNFKVRDVRHQEVMISATCISKSAAMLALAPRTLGDSGASCDAKPGQSDPPQAVILCTKPQP